jgi:hypothetical protein
MPTANGQFKESSQHFFVWFLAKKILNFFLALALFGGGIALLALRLPGWGLFLGLPSVIAGFCLIIFLFDEVARNRIGPKSLHLIKCSKCGKATLAPFWQEEKICQSCKRKATTNKLRKKTR